MQITKDGFRFVATWNSYMQNSQGWEIFCFSHGCAYTRQAGRLMRGITSRMKECKSPRTILSYPYDHGIYNFHVENGFKLVLNG